MITITCHISRIVCENLHCAIMEWDRLVETCISGGHVPQPTHQRSVDRTQESDGAGCCCEPTQVYFCWRGRFQSGKKPDAVAACEDGVVGRRLSNITEHLIARSLSRPVRVKLSSILLCGTMSVSIMQSWFRNVFISSWPPHSPFLNPSEEFFSAWRWKVYDHYTCVTFLHAINEPCSDITERNVKPGFVMPGAAWTTRTSTVMLMELYGQMLKTGLMLINIWCVSDLHLQPYD